MSDPSSDRPFPFSLRALFWCVAAFAVLVALCSGGFERIFFPTTVYSKDSFTPNEEATLTSRMKAPLPPKARVTLASYNKHFGPGEGNITVCIKMPESDGAAFIKTLDGMTGTVYRPLSCPLPEWREARESIETLYSTPDCRVYFSKPVEGEIIVYCEFEDYAGMCSTILSKGKWRWAMPREPSD
jgi:hypothetical protein